MSRRAEMRDHYDDAREELDWLGDYTMETIPTWAAGSPARDVFGQNAHALDVLCIVAAYEKQVRWAVWMQIQSARSEGWSWNDIADAMGVSRQAVVKRFG